jgi:hypothetical protein
MLKKFQNLFFFLKEKNENFLKENMKNPIWNIPVVLKWNLQN